MAEDAIRQFAGMLRESRSAVFFGGAGVSTESGLKDYRSPDGLYHTVRQYGVSPEEILSHSFFLAHPETFYDFYYTYFLQETPRPNPAHLALAELEARGILKAVITQNIDGLHQAAGSRRVLELHGTTHRHFCTACGRDFPTEQVKALAGGVPRCACGGLIRPAVVLYEEALDPRVTDEAVAAIERADLLIIGGTSLAVYPAAGFLRYFRGGRIVLINREETAYDARAALVFRDPIGRVLHAALTALTETEGGTADGQ